MDKTSELYQTVRQDYKDFFQNHADNPLFDPTEYEVELWCTAHPEIYSELSTLAGSAKS